MSEKIAKQENDFIYEEGNEYRQEDGATLRRDSFSDSTGSYVRLHGDDVERICDKILTRNVVRGILPIEVQWVNGSREYIYETTGFKTLDEYMEKEDLSRGGLIRILSGLCDIVKELGEFLLDGQHLVVDIDSIYVGEDGSVCGLYCPEQCFQVGISLNRLTEGILRRLTDEDAEVAQLIYRLHRLTAQGTATWSGLRDFLRVEESEPDLSYTFEDDEEAEKGEQKKSERGIQINKIIKNKMGQSSKGKDKKGKNEDPIFQKIKSHLSAIIMTIGVLTPAVLFKLGAFTEKLSGKVDVFMFIGASVFFIAVAGYGAWRLKVKDKVEVIRDGEDELRVCLVPKIAGLKPIPVKKFPWRIGGDEKRVDAVLDGSGISDVHAHIKREGNTVFLTDDESTGGTFHNSRRLAPWECVRLADGDEVAFDTADYVVEIL